MYNLVYKISDKPYLQTFQYKLLNRIINCRYNLCKWSVLPSGICNYCTEIDTIEHHFYYCSISRTFWSKVFNWLQNIMGCKIHLSLCEVLFGIINYCFGDVEVFTALNVLILIGKWYINKCKTTEKEPSINPFLNILKEKIKVLKLNYTLKNQWATGYI